MATESLLPSASADTVPAATAGAGSAQDGVEFARRFLRRYGFWLLAGAVIFGAVALVAQLFWFEPLHEASATISISPTPKVDGVPAPNLSASGYLQLARSAVILDRTGRELRQAGIFRPGEELDRDRLRSELGKPAKGEEADTSLLILTYWASTQERAVEAVNAWARVLLDLDLLQAHRTTLRAALADSEEQQRRLAEQMEAISSRAHATRVVLAAIPHGLVLPGRYASADGDGDGDGRQQPIQPLSLSREDQATVTAELAMRVVEAEIDLQLLNREKASIDRQVAAYSELAERFEARELDIGDLLEEDTTGLLARVRTRAQLQQPAVAYAQPRSRQLAFKTLLAALAGCLLALIAGASREALTHRNAVSASAT
jgi:hypothetical protein